MGKPGGLPPTVSPMTPPVNPHTLEPNGEHVAGETPQPLEKVTNMNQITPTRATLAVLTAFVMSIGMVSIPGLDFAGGMTQEAHAAEPTLPTTDGKTEHTAAASCWEIKQNDPAATNGVYWLSTPAMGAPEQFYCDQESSGGGWVLVGRGREAWSTASIGSGTPAQVREIVNGPAAFAPKQLSSELIEQLVNEQGIDTLPDGIRLVRARNVQGTQWHDLSFTFSSPRTTWTWQFNNEQRIKNYRIGNQTFTGFSGDKTSNFGRNNGFDRVRTITGSYEGWHMGFGYGNDVRGQSDATSYLWSKNSSTGYARPFTQVYLRPQLLSIDINTEIPSAGTEAIIGKAVVDSFALPQSWGVAGLGAGPASIEGSNEVSAFTEANGHVFVGGNFTRVQRSAGGSGAQEQPYLAAFDRDTGEWIPNFRPTLNNQVKALAALPGNRIAVGGYFTEVNGEPRNGLVVLNAATGAIDPVFTGKLINYLSGGVSVVRSLDVQGDWLYAVGTFTHSTGGSESREVYTRAAARFHVTDGTADQTWNPEFNGTVMSVDASERGDRVYFAGYFSQSKGRTADKAAALAADSEDLMSWAPVFSNRSGGRTGYQQAVKEVGDRVWLGGSEHSLFSYSRDTFDLLSTTIGHNGGDFQAIASYGDVVYGGCHCFETQYEGASQWPNFGTGWTEANAIYGTGAWSATSGAAIPEFNGSFNTRGGAGAWALFIDSAGTLWQGGDWTASTRTGFYKQWSGGFTRQALQDTSAPTTPGGLTANAHSEGVTLSWEASTDDMGVVGYEVLRNDRVIATVTELTTTLSPAPSDTRYFVRAVDARGNASASSPAVTATQAPEPPKIESVIEAGAEWNYWYSATAPTGSWTAAGYDDSAWNTGIAPLGWGHSGIETLLEASAPKPLVSFYRHNFEVATDSAIESLELTVRADDGVVVYANDAEVQRVNVDPGYAGAGTYANRAVSASFAVSNPVTFTVPRSLLVPGTNVISASVHSNYRSTPSHSFELTATATLGEVEPFPEPPVEPETQEFVTAGSEWEYLFASTAPEAQWQSVEFDADAWATGQAPLGWGHTGLGTTLTADSPKPIVSLYRHEFDIAPGTALGEVQLTTRADDGLVLTVNGAEVERVNIDEGAVQFGAYPTYANRAVTASIAVSQPIEVTLPAEAFHTGTNVITASVHSNYRSTPSHSFELTAVATLDGEPLDGEPLPEVPETEADLPSEEESVESEPMMLDESAGLVPQQGEAQEQSTRQTDEAPAVHDEALAEEDSDSGEEQPLTDSPTRSPVESPSELSSGEPGVVREPERSEAPRRKTHGEA